MLEDMVLQIDTVVILLSQQVMIGQVYRMIICDEEVVVMVQLLFQPERMQYIGNDRVQMAITYPVKENGTNY
jgi:hypothetical protein